MKLHKFVSVAIAGTMTLSLIAYGGSKTAETTVASDTTATVESSVAAGGAEAETTEPAPVGGVAKEDLKVGFVYIGDEDEGYTVAHYVGAMEMKETLGLSDDQIIVKWNTSEDETAKDAAMDLADQRCQTVFANSFGHESHVTEVTKEYSEVQFRHTIGFQAASSDLSNMRNYFMSIYEARYMSGVVAGSKLNQMIGDGTVAKDICKIGYTGAHPYAEVISGYTSFFLGVRSVCPDAIMEVKYTNSWASFDLEEEVADALTFNGHVLTSQHADATGASTACKAAGIPCVGHSISMIAAAPKQAPTSAFNNRGAYVTEAVKHALDGAEIPVDWCKGLSDGAVLIIELNEAAVAPGTKEKVEEVELKLASGELRVSGTSTWTQDGRTLDTYEKDGSDIKYISDGYLHESEFASAPAFDILIDGIKTIDN